MKKIRIIADVSASVSREVKVDDDFDPANCNIVDLFWKDNNGLTEDEVKEFGFNSIVDPWKIEDEDGNEIYAD